MSGPIGEKYIPHKATLRKSKPHKPSHPTASNAPTLYFDRNFSSTTIWVATTHWAPTISRLPTRGLLGASAPPVELPELPPRTELAVAAGEVRRCFRVREGLRQKRQSCGCCGDQGKGGGKHARAKQPDRT